MSDASIPVTILDGGMGRQLERMGAPFKLPEWSALALIDAPRFVLEAHQAFIDSGAQIITTNSYGLVPHMIGEDRFARSGRELADRAGRLARQAASGRNIQVAGSLPPLFKSYRPELFQAARAPELLATLVTGLASHVDFWLIETQSSTAEAFAAIDVTRATGLPVWVSYTLRDEQGWRAPAELRSGESVASAIAATLALGVDAVLFNCSQPEVMEEAVRVAASSAARIGVYANAFAPEPRTEEPYAGISLLRADLTPERYLEWARRWVAAGATIVGGCCGVGPEHIAALRAHLT
jgi:S-methylmethionine-dependent homocysteine/selenocysteine methylase